MKGKCPECSKLINETELTGHSCIYCDDLTGTQKPEEEEMERRQAEHLKELRRGLRNGNNNYKGN